MWRRMRNRMRMRCGVGEQLRYGTLDDNVRRLRVSDHLGRVEERLGVLRLVALVGEVVQHVAVLGRRVVGDGLRLVGGLGGLVAVVHLSLVRRRLVVGAGSDVHLRGGVVVAAVMGLEAEHALEGSSLLGDGIALLCWWVVIWLGRVIIWLRRMVVWFRWMIIRLWWMVVRLRRMIIWFGWMVVWLRRMVVWLGRMIIWLRGFVGWFGLHILGLRWMVIWLGFHIGLFVLWNMICWLWHHVLWSIVKLLQLRRMVIWFWRRMILWLRRMVIRSCRFMIGRHWRMVLWHWLVVSRFGLNILWLRLVSRLRLNILGLRFVSRLGLHIFWLWLVGRFGLHILGLRWMIVRLGWVVFRFWLHIFGFGRMVIRLGLYILRLGWVVVWLWLHILGLRRMIIRLGSMVLRLWLHIFWLRRMIVRFRRMICGFGSMILRFWSMIRWLGSHIQLMRLFMVAMLMMSIHVVLLSIVVGHGQAKHHLKTEGMPLIAALVVHGVRHMVLWLWRNVVRLRDPILGVEAKDLLQATSLLWLWVASRNVMCLMGRMDCHHVRHHMMRIVVRVGHRVVWNWVVWNWMLQGSGMVWRHSHHGDPVMHPVMVVMSSMCFVVCCDSVVWTMLQSMHLVVLIVDGCVVSQSGSTVRNAVIPCRNLDMVGVA